MGELLISDEELTDLGAPPGSLPSIDEDVREIHIRAASDLFRNSLRSRYIVADDWTTDDYNNKLAVARLATYSLFYRRGFDPETDKQILNGFRLAKDHIAECLKGDYYTGLRAKRRVHIGAQTVSPYDDGWTNWRLGYCSRRDWE